MGLTIGHTIHQHMMDNFDDSAVVPEDQTQDTLIGVNLKHSLPLFKF